MENKKKVEPSRYDPYGRGRETLPFKVVVKPRSVMGDYIALHGLLPQNELPENLRYKIPEDEIWMREDVFDDPKRRELILQGHEKYELALMETDGLTYKQAHRRAELHEKFYLLEQDLEKPEKHLKMRNYESVKIVEPKRKPEVKTKRQNNHSIIRTARSDDLDAISEIEQKCFSGPIAYSKRQLTYLIMHANSASFVESCGGVIRGFVIVTYHQRSLTSHIETIDVDPTYAKLGIGLRLLTFAEDDMRKRGKHWSQLEVSESNGVAFKLYNRAGYTFKERVKGYYRFEHGGTRDAMRMVKAL